MTNIHPTAAGYQNTSEAYENGRPAYTLESVRGIAEALGLSGESRVVEVGAGTGKFTRVLAEICPHITAVEPVDAMREKLVSILPNITALPGTGENIPVSDSMANAVVIANAFHWFSNEAALREIHRVLKPDGALGLIWNIDGVFTSDWGREIDALLDEKEADTPQFKTGRWKEPFRQISFFSTLESRRFPSYRNTSAPAILDRVMSISFIAALSHSDQETFRAEVEKILSSHPDTRGGKSVRVSFDTEIFWSFKR